MANFLSEYITEYDADLSGESYFDPIGTLIIWSAYGQEIFKSRVNSISNDVRNYTLNLFNHHLIKRLIEDEDVKLSSNLANAFGVKDRLAPPKHTLAFKHACVLLLENIFAYSILKHEHAPSIRGVDSRGVLGITKARRIWLIEQAQPVLTFSHEKAGQILVRQLGLGVSGRYKTPLRELGFFSDRYEYRYSPNSRVLWDEAAVFIKKKERLRKLDQEAFRYLKEQLASLKLNQKIRFADVPDSLTEAFVRAFSSPGAVGSYARDYWLGVTRLDQGAAGALFKVLTDPTHHDRVKTLEPREIVMRALKERLDEPEKKKLSDINLLEPFLAEVALLFTLLTTARVQTLASVEKAWRGMGRNKHTLPDLAMKVRGQPDVVRVLSGMAKRRLERLLRLADAATVTEQIRLLIEYHAGVMESRGQASWLTLDGDSLALQARVSFPPEPKAWPTGGWVNNYYLPQFRRLVLGYQGESA